jgi:hypothetical protein
MIARRSFSDESVSLMISIMHPDAVSSSLPEAEDSDLNVTRISTRVSEIESLNPQQTLCRMSLPLRFSETLFRRMNCLIK